MNVVDARANVVGIVKGAERFMQLHLRTRRFDGVDVGIHRGHGFDDVVELRIAHVRVDLRFRLGASGREPERVDPARRNSHVDEARLGERTPGEQVGLTRRQLGAGEYVVPLRGVDEQP